MSSTSEYQKNDLKLSQYHRILHCGSDTNVNAERIFFEEFNINHQLCSATKDRALIGCTALHIAAKKDRLSDIEFLLSRGANFMIKNHVGCTPIHCAIEENCGPLSPFHKSKPSCMSLLSAQVSSGNMENPKDENGLSHFHIACMADHAEAIEFFLKSGTSVDETTSMDSKSFPGYTPLHLAAKYSAVQAIKLLLSYGANAQLKDAKGMSFWCTLLELRIEISHRCSRPYKHYSDSEEHDNLQIFNFLLESGIAIEDAGLTKFHVACSGTEVSIAERFLDEVTDINEAVDFGVPRWAGCTALHFAAYSSVEMVKMLVKNGANILAENALGESSLDMYIKKHGVKGVHDVLSLDDSWRSVLMSDRDTRLLSLVLALTGTNQFKNFLETREHVVNTFVPLDSPIWPGFTPLHVAVKLFTGMIYRAEERYEHVFKALIARGANVNAQDIRGRSPIHLAFRKGINYVPIQKLLEYKDKIEEAVDEDNLSHLLVACENRNVSAVEKILQTNVDVNVAYKGKRDLNRVVFGSTPLHRAARCNEIANLLLQRGANPYSKDANGTTPIHHTAGMEDSALLALPDLKDSVAEDAGLSHLHVACYNGNSSAAEKLLDRGADVNQPLLRQDVLTGIGDSRRNDVGDTPFDLTSKPELLELLMRRGAKTLLREAVAVVDRDMADKLKSVVAPLTRDDELFERLEKEVGLTMLHLACSRRDVDLAKTLIASGADVNARIHERLRFWPGYAPLHVVMDDDNPDGSSKEIVLLLLDNGCDVSLPRCAAGDTALFLAYKRKLPNLRAKVISRYSCMRMILKAHKDFAVDPASDDGLSCFYVACSIGDIVAVEKFLKHGANANQMFFTKIGNKMDICTPLHLAAAINEYTADSITQLKLIDLLLNYGADVHAENLRGDTALHAFIRRNKPEDVVTRLVRSKANMNSRNIWDETPLEVLIATGNDVTVERINSYLKFGCSFNVFNSLTDNGLIGMALTSIPYADLLNLIKISMINFPNLMQVDDMGRTVIHNIVSGTNNPEKQQPAISDSQYATLIKEVNEFGCCINAQDKLGRTPLHLAASFRNAAAISGLLAAGADVNMIDVDGKTAFSYIYESCSRCSDKNVYYDGKKHSEHNHIGVILIFVMHMKKMLWCRLDLNQINEKLMFKTFETFQTEKMSMPDRFKQQVKQMKSLKIAKSKLTLGTFLSETRAVVAYATLPEAERDAVDEFFKDKSSDTFAQYGEVAGILLFQYRKAVDRVKLIEPALLALNTLARLSVPDLCSTAILKYLTNSELKSMIEATA